MKSSFRNAIDKYLRTCKNDDWVFEESYKFEFANFIYQNVNWNTQSDKEILEILKESQKIKYTGNVRGIQFILKSGREKLSEFISLKDVELLRSIQTNEISRIDWSERSMSYTALSAWIASLFPKKFSPVPLTGFDKTINYLFGVEKDSFPKTGEKYIIHCQSYLNETREVLSLYPVENFCLNEWNKFYKNNPELNISIKTELSDVDWVWLTQDFHLFVHRNILGLYKKKTKELKIQDVFEPTVIEGSSILAKHMRHERNSSFIRKIKEKALAENKMLNCEICGFSFLDNFGEIGEGFIEAHHKNPLYENSGETKTTINDIALVCSNCHRMLHRGNPNLKVEELRQIINER